MKKAMVLLVLCSGCAIPPPGNQLPSTGSPSPTQCPPGWTPPSNGRCCHNGQCCPLDVPYVGPDGRCTSVPQSSPVPLPSDAPPPTPLPPAPTPLPTEPDPDSDTVLFELFGDACRSFTLDDIRESIQILREEREDGVSLEGQLAFNEEFCEGDNACLSCFDSISLFVDLDFADESVPTPQPPPVEPSTVTLTIVIVGNGQVVPPGGSFLQGTVIEVQAIADVGWAFDHWEDDLHGEQPQSIITLNTNTRLVAVFVQLPPPPDVPVLVEVVLFADDGTFLGVVSDDSFDPDSIANRFGPYGSTFSPTSIWNEFGEYGSRFGSLSAWNEFTETPPLMFQDDLPVGYVTANSFLTPGVHPNILAIEIGRTDVLR